MDFSYVIKNKKLTIYLLFCIAVLVGLGLVFHLYGWNALRIIRYLVLAAGLAGIAWIDWHQKIIPNKVLLVLIIYRVILLAVEWIIRPESGPDAVIGALIGAAIGGGLFGLCYLLSRGGMGAGDVKLMLVEGFFLGNGSIMPTLIIIALCAAAFNIFALLMKKVTLKSEVPFGPFVFIGTILSMALGV